MTNLLILTISILFTNVLQANATSEYGDFSTNNTWTLQIRWFTPTAGVFSVQGKAIIDSTNKWVNWRPPLTNGVGIHTNLVPVPYWPENNFRLSKL